MKIAIIGGSGAMGQNLLHFFSRNNISAIAIGRKTQNYQELVESADILFISVPIHAIDTTISKISTYNLEGKMVINLASNMSAGLQQLDQLSCETMCMHLMFGPDILSYKNKNILLSSKSTHTSFMEIVQQLESEGARITYTTPEHHDEMMGYIQAISHFVLISLGTTLAQSSPSKKELLRYASFSFSQTSEIYSRLARQPSELWANIQMSNTKFPHIFKQFLQVMTELKKCVDEKDMESYDTIFSSMKLFWNEENETLTAPPQSISKPRTGTIGTLGPQGTHSHSAIKKYMQLQKMTDPSIDFYPSITAVVQAVANGELRIGFVPFENSTKGIVIETLESIAKTNVHITTELQVPIQHCIAGNAETLSANVTHIYSHPQALFQCQEYIQKEFPNAECVETVSTAAAFEYVAAKKNPLLFAIGSELGAKLYGLQIHATNIQDIDTNVTSFVAITKDVLMQEGVKTKLLLVPNVDKPGLLYDILSVFKKRNINVSGIESRPSKKSLGTYVFYATIDVSASVTKELIPELTAVGILVTSLGSYNCLK